MRAGFVQRDAGKGGRLLRCAHGDGGHTLVHDCPGLGVGKAEIEFVRTRAPIERRDDDAGELACPMDRRRLPAVLQQSDKMVAPLKPERVEGSDQRRYALVPGAIREPHVAVGDRQRTRVAGNTGQKTAAEIKHGSEVAYCSAPHARVGPAFRQCYRSAEMIPLGQV